MDVLPVLKVLLTIFITPVAVGSNLYLSLGGDIQLTYNLLSLIELGTYMMA